MADEQVRNGAAANQEDVQHNNDSAQATIRRAALGGEISYERILRVCGKEEEKLDRRQE